jgi:hypothetical protein
MRKISIDGLIGFLVKSKEIRSVTQMIDDKTRVRVTKKSKRLKEYIVTIGRMNYEEREFQKKLKRQNRLANHMVWTYPKKSIK